ncbi:MAG: ADP-glyceromanno-heptose 6-epimerase [Bacteroidetes bacterium]|nr:ADP-glyceromanno-heptose 6-epimerase [Bacteroidota bacterium]MBS1610670.1 ADP-glyceromanno-heptose 6-epimerase [Bacteroidota bacterium]
MDRNAVIIITGAAGFIGSCLTGYLNRKGYYNIIIVDDFSDENKKHNYEEKKICARVDKDELFDWLSRYKIRIDFVFHMGGHIGYDQKDSSLFGKLNVEYSKQVWGYCTEKQIPLVYASSEATYGSGNAGFSDSESPDKLNPENSYGISKNEFDKWALHHSRQYRGPLFWAGLKLFDVYGPNEYHKGNYASAVYHLFQQAHTKGSIKLYKSIGKNGNTDPGRDFVYVKDVVDVCYWLMQKSAEENNSFISGLYNVGTGKARTFTELAEALSGSLNKKISIEYNEPAEPADINYSYSEAEIKKLKEAGYNKKFYSLEDGVKTYIQYFLSGNKYY